MVGSLARLPQSTFTYFPGIISQKGNTWGGNSEVPTRLLQAAHPGRGPLAATDRGKKIILGADRPL